MVDSVANVLLETLRDLLIEEAKFLSGVSDKVKKVEGDLKTIHGLLMDADKNRRRKDSQALRVWIDELKELVFRAENVLEEYAEEVESRREGKSLRRKLQRFMGILCECYSVHQAGNEIDDIRSSLSDLTTRLRSIAGGGGGEGSSTSSEQEQKRLLRLRYAHEVDQHFVGMEKDIHRVVSMVEKDSVSLISICGMGGLGKTTFARKIYHRRDVKQRFDGCAWVCVTQQFQAEAILKEILKQIGGLRPDMEGLTDFVRGLHNALEQKKCLIVIDDIWENDHWNILKAAFPKKNCQVILTTRTENIITSQEGYVHKLGFLSEDEGWELLHKIAFPIKDDASQVLESRSKSFEEIGRQMVQKCGRLPLAVTVIGGILRQKQQILAEWETVSENMDSYLKHGGEGIENDTRVKLVLDLSFDVLPYYLKPCFLYLTCFREDENIRTERLYLLWMAEGLISSEEKGKNETLRDVAERYLTELAFRCMVQVESHFFNFPRNKFISCRLHDLMRDLCSSKAEEEKFIKRVDFSKHMKDISSAIGASIHRVAINLENDDDDTLRKIRMAELKDLRSCLFLSNTGFTRRRAVNFSNIINLENSKHLRILMVDGIEFEYGNLPCTIGKQIYLKYLSLSGCNVRELPEHICDLKYLQTLDLRVFTSGKFKLKLPNVIWKMKRLRHLFLFTDIEVIGGGKLKLDGLNELETLEKINSKSVCIADVINLTNLRNLVAKFEEDADSLSKIVDYLRSDKCKLRETSLVVESCDLRNVLNNVLMIRSLISLEICNCEIGCNFPSYKEGMSPNLGCLEIKNSKIVGDVMDVMGKFPMLRELWLEGEIFEEEVKIEMRSGANSFPELKELYLFDLKNLHKWEVENGAMPKLVSLIIWDCRKLEKLPDRLKSFSTLEVLHCLDMSEEFVGRYKRGGENGEGEGQDYAHFSHIRDLRIR